MPDKITPQEFASKVKQKYPAYAGMDDNELVNKFIAKYPVYKDQIDFGDSGDNGIGVLGHIGGKFWQGVSTGGSILKGIGEQGDAFDRGVSSLLGVQQSNSPVEENTLYKAGNAIEKGLDAIGITATNPKYSASDGSFIQNARQFAVNDVPQGFGSMVPFLVATAAGAPEAAAIPALEGQVLSGAQQLGRVGYEGLKAITSPAGYLGGSQAIDQTFQEARKAGKHDDEAFSIALKNYLGGATEGIPLEHIFHRLNNTTGKGIMKYLKQSTAGGLEEGFQEALQGYWENQVAKGNYDPERDPMMGVLRGGGAAFVTGFLLPLASNTPNISAEMRDKIISSLQGKKLEKHPVDQVTAEATTAAKSMNTGDPSLDAPLDALAEHSASFVDQMYEKVRKIAGNKQSEEEVAHIARLQKAQADYLDLQDQLRSLENKDIIEQGQRDMANELNTRPVIAKPIPASEENEFGPGVQEMDYHKLNPPTGDLKFAPSSTIDSFNQETGEPMQKESHPFTFKNNDGKAVGKVVHNAAVIDRIDATGKGKNLYGQVIDALRKQGINMLTVPLQSPESQAALSKKVKAGELTVTNSIEVQGKKWDTQFKINPKVETNDTQNKQGIQSDLREGEKPIIQQPIQSGRSKKTTRSGILQASQSKRKKVGQVSVIAPVEIKVPAASPDLLAKEEQRKADKLENQRIKLQGKIGTAIKSKPYRKVASLDKIIDQAHQLGLENVKAEAQKHLDKELERQKAVAEEKTESKELRLKRVTKHKTKEEIKAEKAEEKAKHEAKKKAQTIHQPVEGVKVTRTVVNPETGIGERVSTEATHKEIKEAYINDVAYLRHIGNPAYLKAAEKYIKFRDSESERQVKAGKKALPKMTVERILQLSQAEEPQKLARKRAENDSRTRGAITKKLSSLKAEGAEVAAIQKAQAELEQKLRTNVEKLLSLPHGSIADLSGMGLSSFMAEGVNQSVKEHMDPSKLHEVSITELLNQMSPNHILQHGLTADLFKAYIKNLAKLGRGIRIYIYDHSGTGGFHATTKNYDVLMFTKGTFNDVESSRTALHEIVHGYMSILAHAAFKTDHTFAAHINDIYDVTKGKLIDRLNGIVNQLLKLARKLPEGAFINESRSFLEFTKDNLSDEDFAILNAAFGYNEEMYGNSKQNAAVATSLFAALHELNLAKDRKITAENIVNKLFLGESKKLKSLNLYGFQDQREFLAEALSSPAFANLLNQIPYSSQLRSTNGKTILGKIFEYLKDFVNRHVFKGTSAYEELEHILTNFDEMFIGGPEFSDKIDPYYKVKTIGDLQRTLPGKSLDLLAGLQKINLAVAEDDQEIHPDFKKAKMLKEAPDANKPIIRNIANTLEKRSDIKSVQDVADYITRVNSHLSEDKQLGKAYEELAWKKIQGMRKARVKWAAEFKQLKAAAKDTKKYRMKENFKYRYDIEAYSAADINRMKFDEVRTFLTGFQNIINDQITSTDAYNLMIKYGIVENKKQEMLVIAEDLNKRVSNLTSEFSNPSTLSTIIGKYNKQNASVVLKNIYGGMMKIMSSIGMEKHKFFQEIAHISEKYNLDHLSLARVGMYGSMFSTTTDPDYHEDKWRQEVRENADFAVEASQAKLAAFNEKKYHGELSKKQIEREIEVAKELRSKVSGKFDMNKILTPGQQELYEHIRDFAESHENDFQRNSVAAWGNDNYQKRFNYFPTQAQGKTTGIDKDNLIDEGKANLFEAAGQTTEKNKANVYGKRVWSNYRRMNPNGYFYDFDALSLSSRWSQKMLYDLYATTELKALNRLLSSNDFQKAVGDKVHQAFTKQLKSIAGVGHIYSGDNLGGVAKAALKWRDKVYTAAIATGGQMFSQASSGVGAATVISMMAGPKGIIYMAKAIKATTQAQFSSGKLQKFLEDNGLGIQLRDILFEKYLTPKDFETFNRRRSNQIVNTIENTTEWALRSGDKLGARIVWFTAYFKAGGTLENPTTEAVLEAERWVGMMQNMSDITFTAPGFKYDNVWKKTFMSTMYAFKAFAVNSYINTLSSAKYSLQSHEARTVLAGQIGAVLAYQAAAEYMVKPIYDGIVNAIMGKGPDDDDDEEEKKKRISNVQTIMVNSAWDLTLGQVAPSFVDQGLRMLFNKTVAPKLYKPEDDFVAFDQRLDSPLYSHTDVKDLYRDAFGPGWQDAADFFVQGIDVITPAQQAEDYLDDPEKLNKVDVNQQAYMWNIILNVGAGLPFIPLRGDLKKVFKRVNNENKARSLQEIKNGSFEGSGEEN